MCFSKLFACGMKEGTILFVFNAKIATVARLASDVRGGLISKLMFLASLQSGESECAVRF